MDLSITDSGIPKPCINGADITRSEIRNKIDTLPTDTEQTESNVTNRTSLLQHASTPFKISGSSMIPDYSGSLPQWQTNTRWPQTMVSRSVFSLPTAHTLEEIIELWYHRNRWISKPRARSTNYSLFLITKWKESHVTSSQNTWTLRKPTWSKKTSLTPW